MMRSVYNYRWKDWFLQIVFSLIATLVVLSVTAEARSKVACEPVAASNCSCELDNNGGTYDLQGLVHNTIIPRFQAVVSGQNVIYLYDPCRVFSFGDCKDVAACTLDTTSHTNTTIAVFDNLIYDYDDSDGKLLTIKYTDGTGPASIKTSVTYECDDTVKEATIQLISGPPVYNFLLTSSFICKQPFPPEVSSISFGTFLCVVVPVFFLCYFSFGFLYLFFIKHETWRNAIPHHQFWFTLPGLIKEGASYTWNTVTCKLNGSPTSGYDQI